VIWKLSTSLVVALVGLVLVTGCGGSSTSTSEATQTTTASQAPTNPVVQQAVAACQQRINTLSPTVPAFVKRSLDGVCEKDASRGLAAVEKGRVNLCLDAMLNEKPPAKERERDREIPFCRKPR
jgi:uncharacterized lipoprotein YajG